MKHLFSRCLGAALVVALFGTTASANQLVDPGFENPITFDGPPFLGIWEGFNSGAGTFGDSTTNMPRSGAASLELVIDNTANAFAGAFQDINTSGGQLVTFSGWHKATVGPGGTEIRIEFKDSLGDEISRTPNATPLIGANYEYFEIMGTAPAGAEFARLTYAIQSFGGPATQTVFVDDVSGVSIPEPAAALLAALAGVAMIGRRS